MSEADLRGTLEHMLCVLGAPVECSQCECPGCSYEQQEATILGLQALGYLERTHTLREVVQRDDGGSTNIYDTTIEPDPEIAYENFMKSYLREDSPDDPPDEAGKPLCD